MYQPAGPPTPGGEPVFLDVHDAGLDYVSCSPYRIPVARLEAGRAAVA